MRIRSLSMVVLLLAASLLGPAESLLSQSPAEGGSAATASNLTLRPGDILRITVWPETNLSGEFVIEDSGNVYLPYLEAVPAAGKDIDELRAELRRGYGEFLRSPVVSVTPSFRITITGEIQRPGVHMITPATSLIDVIGMAGGFRSGADQEAVRVVRPGQVLDFDAFRALETGVGMDAIELRSGDHIVVPARRPPRFTWRTAFEATRTVSTLVLIWDRFFR